MEEGRMVDITCERGEERRRRKKEGGEEEEAAQRLEASVEFCGGERT